MKIFLASPHSYPGMFAEQIKGGSGETFIKEGDKAAMRIFLAGGISGNLKPYWSDVAKGKEPDEAMKIYLAGGHINGKYQQIKDYEKIEEYHPYILESFYYCDADTEKLLPYFGDFLLDSGAFTFMQGTGGQTDWEDYIRRYADFIVRNRIQKYFELDIDVVVGYEKVKEFRKQLERLTGRPCIPVWHLSRGLEEYRKMCDEYDYVAIGGIVSGEIRREKYGAFPALIGEAHKRGAKVHGLGFTALGWLKACHFDSVDSTAWTTGNRFGFVYYFNGQTMRKKDAPDGHRLGDSRRVALNNYTEWIKYQKWADTHL